MKRGLRAGRLRHKIELQSFTTSEDNYGEQIKTWSTDATVYARVSPVGGGESFEGASRDANVTHEVEIRHRSGVTPKMRVVHDSRTLHIERVINPDERDISLVLMCRELDD